jgi:dihydroorotase
MKIIFIINGRVIDPSRKLEAVTNVLIKDGRIAAVNSSKNGPEDAEVIDAKGCIIAPGFIDMHCHLRDPGEEYKEDIASGSSAAAAGGFTTICCMANTKPVNDCASVTEYILNRARAMACVNVLPVGALTKGQKGESLADIGDLASAGVVAVSNDGEPLMNGAIMRRAMEYAASFKLPVISHAEDLNLRGRGVMHEGPVSTELGLRGIPSEAEESIIMRDILLANLTGSRLHIAHISTAGGVEMVREAKKLKLPVTCEVTPHHLTLTDQAVHGYDTNTKVNPPLRSESDRKELLTGLADGTIDAIATDHAPHDITEKERGFEESSFGIIGFETALPLCLKLVHDKKISMKRMIDALSCRPAKILGLQKKGSIAAGFDADITIFNPNEPVVIRASSFKSKSRNTPFDGWRLRGKVVCTIVGGNIVYKT